MAYICKTWSASRYLMQIYRRSSLNDQWKDHQFQLPDWKHVMPKGVGGVTMHALNTAPKRDLSAFQKCICMIKTGLRDGVKVAGQAFLRAPSVLDLPEGSDANPLRLMWATIVGDQKISSFGTNGFHNDTDHDRCPPPVKMERSVMVPVSLLFLSSATSTPYFSAKSSIPRFGFSCRALLSHAPKITRVGKFKTMVSQSNNGEKRRKMTEGYNFDPKSGDECFASRAHSSKANVREVEDLQLLDEYLTANAYKKKLMVLEVYDNRCIGSFRIRNANDHKVVQLFRIVKVKPRLEILSAEHPGIICIEEALESICFMQKIERLDWYISGERTDRDRLEYFERKWMRTMCQGEGNDLEYTRRSRSNYKLSTSNNAFASHAFIWFTPLLELASHLRWLDGVHVLLLAVVTSAYFTPKVNRIRWLYILEEIRRHGVS
eukprot:jgi/Bigna1/83176/fgenesh1_pg.103_\